MGIPATLSSVPNVTPDIQYVATLNQTVFPYPFPITQDSDLVVVVNGVTLATDNGYSVSGVGNPTGGTITFTLGQSAGAIVTLFRNIPIQRLTQIGQNSGFSSTAFNAEYNNIYLLLQQLEESINLCLQIPNTNNPAGTTTLTPVAYANKYLSFDASGNPQPALLTSSGSITAALINGLINGQTAAELAAGVTPTNLFYTQGNVLRYGAVPDATGVTDSTVAVQAAVTVGSTVYAPAGQYNLSSMISMTTPYQRIGGDGLQSCFFAKSTFNTSQQGMFNYTAGGNDDGPWFQNLRFLCDQSVVASSGVRANLIQYPACLFMRNAPRFRVLQCRIEQFLIGIDAQGLSAGFVLDDVDMCTYFLGLVINGSGDTIRLKDYHYVFQNSWTANQIAIWGDGGNTAIASGRNDGIDISDSLFLGPGIGFNSFTGVGTNFAGTYPGSGFLTGNTKAQIVNSGFDTASQLLQNAAGSWINVFNTYFSNGPVGHTNQVQVNAGAVQIMGGQTQSTPVATVPYFSLNNTSGALAQLNIGGGFTFNAPAGCSTLVALTGTTLALANISNCVFLVSPGATTAPLVTSVGANVQLTFTNNQFAATAQTGNIALSIDTDNVHVVTGNAFNGWNIAIPASAGIASASQTVANPGVFTTATQAWSAGQAVYITGTAPGGFSLGTIYYVIAAGLSVTTAQLSATIGGSGIACSATAACTLVPINPTTFTKAVIANNSNRGTLNFNAASIKALQGTSGSASTVAANTTVYLGCGGTAATAAGEVSFQMPKAGNIVGFLVNASTGPGGVTTFTYTVYKNGSATAMTGSTTGGNGNTAVAINPFAVAINDLIELQLVTSAAANAGYHRFSILYEPA